MRHANLRLVAWVLVAACSSNAALPGAQDAPDGSPSDGGGGNGFTDAPAEAATTSAGDAEPEAAPGIEGAADAAGDAGDDAPFAADQDASDLDARDSDHGSEAEAGADADDAAASGISVADGAPAGVPPGDYTLTAVVAGSGGASRVTFEQRVGAAATWSRVGEWNVPTTAKTVSMVVRVTSPADAFRATGTTAIDVLSLSLIPLASGPGLLVRGAAIVDVSNKNAVFRGVNTGGFASSALGNGNPTDAVVLADLNASVHPTILRVPIGEYFWLPFFKDSYDPAFRQRVIDYVGAVTSLGIIAIVDLHFSGQGDPTFTWSNDGAVKQDWLVMPDGPSLDFWSDVAAIPTFKNNPRVVFEIYNEPKVTDPLLWRNGGQVTAPKRGGGTNTWTAPGHQALYDVIRKAGATNAVLVDGISWGGDLLAPVSQAPLDGYNIVYTAHAYQDTTEFQNAQAHYPAHLDSLVAPVLAAPYNRAVILDEFGIPLRPSAIALLDNATPYENSVIGWANGHGLSWAAWGWYPDSYDSFGLLKTMHPPAANAKGQAVVNAIP